MRRIIGKIRGKILGYLIWSHELMSESHLIGNDAKNWIRERGEMIKRRTQVNT